MAEQADGFLSRWARRKQEVRQAEEELARQDRSATEPSDKVEGEEGPALPAAVAESNAELQPAEEPAEPIPDIDSLTRESDFGRFLKPDVPEAVRRQALHKLWRLDPVFANLDGLNDYDEDYSQIGKSPMATLRSLYRVGRGMISTEEASAEVAEGQPAGEAPSAERRVEPESGADEDAVDEGDAEEAAAAPAPAAEEPSQPSVEPRSIEEGSPTILQIDEPKAPEVAGMPAPARRRWAGFRVDEPNDSGIS